MDERLHVVTHFGIDDTNRINYDGCEGIAILNHLIYDELPIELYIRLKHLHFFVFVSLIIGKYSQCDDRYTVRLCARLVCVLISLEMLAISFNHCRK